MNSSLEDVIGWINQYIDKARALDCTSMTFAWFKVPVAVPLETKVRALSNLLERGCVLEEKRERITVYFPKDA